MGAVMVRLRAELRERWRATVGIALLIGLVGGVTLASFAGARRTQSAYRRFERAQNASDVVTASGDAARVVGLEPVPIEAVRALPQVQTLDSARYFLFGARRLDGTELLARAEWALESREGPPVLDVAHAVEGRLASADADDEIAVGFEVARSAGIHVDDEILVDVLSLRAVAESPTGFDAPPLETIRMRVVGLVAAPGVFPPRPSYAELFASPAFRREHGEGALAMTALMMRLRPGATVAGVKDELDRLAGGRELVTNQSEVRDAIQRSMGVLAKALGLFGLVAGLAGLFVVAQALGRHVLIEATEHPVLRALGMSPGQRRTLLLVRAAIAATAGAVVAVVLASVASVIFPVGVARIAEPAPGLSFDAVVLGVGALGIVFLSVLSATPAVWRAGTIAGAGEAQVASSRVSRATRLVADAGFPPSAVAGVRLALEPGRGRTAAPVRSAIVGVALGLAALTTALTVGASLTTLLETPRLYGWDWTMAVANPYVPGVASFVEPALDAEDDIAGLSSGLTIGRIQLAKGERRRDVSTQAFDLVRGRVHPPIVEGRWPDATDEIVVGSKVMRDLGAGMGQTLTASVGDRSIQMRVVGRAVFPSFDDPNAGELGDAVGMTFEAYRRLVPGAERSAYFITLALGADTAAVQARLNGKLATITGAVEAASTPDELEDLSRVNDLPIVLAGVLAVFALATLAHTLFTSIRRRRRDLAILKTIGFVSRQIRATVMWQGAALATLSLLLGIPLGVLTGRWLWTLLADQIGFLPEPVVAVAATLITVPATLAAAALIALAPGRAAQRTRPGPSLRTVE